LGSSRMELGFSAPAFRRQYPQYEVTQLAVSGSQPIAALEDLANDQAFKGVVICDVFEGSFEPDRWSSQDYVVKRYHSGQSLDFELNLQSSLFFQERFTIVNPFLNLGKLAVLLATTRSLRAPSHVTTFSDRFQAADFAKIPDMARFRANQRSRILAAKEQRSSPDEWLSRARRVAELARRIQERGGKVAFVHMPNGRFFADELEKRYPRASYWDNFAREGSVIAIRAEDYPELSNFNMPDEVHLDVRDVPRFTEALMVVLAERGVLPDLFRRGQAIWRREAERSGGS
jgi:hypothetical protein